MLSYVKLFNTILDSSVWQEDDPVRILWITMLAKADREGIVRASVPGLAHAARVTLEDCKRGLERFMAPDPMSTSQEEGGKRIRKVEGGWQLINHKKYREMLGLAERREYNRQKQAEYRAKSKANLKGMMIPEIIREKTRYTEQLEREDDKLRESSAVYHVPGELPQPSPTPPQSLQDSI